MSLSSKITSWMFACECNLLFIANYTAWIHLPCILMLAGRLRAGMYIFQLLLAVKGKRAVRWFGGTSLDDESVSHFLTFRFTIEML